MKGRAIYQATCHFGRRKWRRPKSPPGTAPSALPKLPLPSPVHVVHGQEERLGLQPVLLRDLRHGRREAGRGRREGQGQKKKQRGRKERLGLQPALPPEKGGGRQTGQVGAGREKEGAGAEEAERREGGARRDNGGATALQQFRGSGGRLATVGRDPYPPPPPRISLEGARRRAGGGVVAVGGRKGGGTHLNEPVNEDAAHLGVDVRLARGGGRGGTRGEAASARRKKNSNEQKGSGARAGTDSPHPRMRRFVKARERRTRC